MKTLFVVLSLFVLSAKAQTPVPFTPDPNTVALWHFNEASGTFVRDSSAMQNHGNAYGTTVVAGRFGNARSFDGFSDYVYVNDPSNGSLDFGTNQSFTVDVWFKTTTTTGFLLRKGLAPTPGYDLLISNGRVQGEVGNRQDSRYPDTLVRIRSTQTYNDGQWHLASLERDRRARTISLYVDGILATPPVNDPITFPLWNERPLTFGKWENNVEPTYYAGLIDEVRISNIARHAPHVISDTVALWRYDEVTGNVVIDSGPYGNDGAATNATIVPGRIGNARSFSGSYSYVVVPYPGTASMNFSVAQSFAVQAWFKTSQTDTGEIIRRGLAPVPGFALRILHGHVQGIVGNREFSVPPDTLLRITSARSDYNDGQWHIATLVRDRQVARLFLYVDGVVATAPMNDNFPLPISNDRPLTMGAWENFVQPTFFRGLIDEVSVLKGARHPINIGVPNIDVIPSRVNFGNVLVGSTVPRPVEIRNRGLFDTLMVSSVESNSSVFASNTTALIVPPGESRPIQVTYAPQTARTDTGSLFINSNDPNRVTVRLPLAGQAFAPSVAPLISSIVDVPEDQGRQVRVIWYRSTYDGVIDSNRIVEYGLWRRVGSANLWDFIATIPAVRFEQYSFVAPTLFDSSRAGIRWSVFKVSAQTANNVRVFFSGADSGYSVDNVPPVPPRNLVASLGLLRVNLLWDPPTDPDVASFAIHRSDNQNFIPTEQNRIGTAGTNNFVDTNIGGGLRYYYYVIAFDSTGNQSDPSNQAMVLLTEVPGGNLTPIEYKLHQNYPNPFNPSSSIQYDVPDRSHVRITVYDMLGKAVTTLIDEVKAAGRHVVSWNAGTNASGVYFTRMESGGFISVRKMLLMR